MDQRINILLVNKFREIGGSEVFLLELIRNLNRRKYRPVLSLIGDTCDEAYRILAKEDIKLYDDLFRNKAKNDSGLDRLFSPQGRKSPYDVTAIFRLARILKKEKIDILFYLDKHAALNLAPPAAFLAATPVLVGSFHTPGLRFSLIEKLLFPLTDIAVATSRFHREYLLEHLAIPPDKIRIINNGISPGRFTEVTNANRTKEMLGIPDPSPVGLIFSRLVPEKGHVIFLKCVRKVLESQSDAHFLVVGTGPERERLEALSKELNLAPNVHFLGFRDDIDLLLSISDFTVLASYSEFFPYTILESMLMGVPVIATRVGAIPEMIVHNRTGRLVPAGDADQLGEAIMDFIKDPARMQEMGKNARDHVLNHLTSEHMAAGFEDLFDHLVAARGIQ